MPVSRTVRVLLRRWLRNMIRLHSSPHEIALGFAVGLFVGWTPTMGIQMIEAALLATVVGANRIIAIATVWFTNYLTAIPLYGFAWWLGTRVLQLLGLVQRPETSEGIVQKLKDFFHLSWQEQIVQVGKGFGEMWVGCVILGLLSGSLGYFVMRRLVEVRRARLAGKRVRASAAGDAGPGPK